MSLVNLMLDSVAAVERRELPVRTARGDSVADLWLPVSGTAPYPVVLLGHGGGYPHQGREMPRLRKLAQRLAEQAGAAILVIDGPVHGARSPSLPTPLENHRAARRALLDPDLQHWFTAEWQAAFDAASALNEIDGRRAGYIGFSMGTLLGVSVVAAIPEIGAAVFGLGGVPKRGGVTDLARKMGAPEAVQRIVDEEDDAEIRGRVLLEDAARITDREVLLLNTTGDEVFPIDGVFRFSETLASPTRVVFYRGGHLELPDEAIDLAAWFLRRRFDGQSPDGAPAGAW